MFVAAQARAERSGKPWGSGVHPTHIMFGHGSGARERIDCAREQERERRRERVGLSNLILDIA